MRKTPLLLQMEATECGAACLGIILAHYGRFLPLEVLRQECGVGRDGCKASNVMRAARRLGLEGKGERLSAAELANTPLPAIVHWEFNHFVVLEGFKGGYAYLNDPAFGHRKVDMDAFRKAYTGIVMFLRPGKDFKRGGERFKVSGAIAKKLLADRGSLIFVLVSSLLLVIPGLATPAFNQIFIDDVLSGRHKDWLYRLLFAMAGFCFLVFLLNWLRSSCLIRWQTKLTIRDSAAFFRHVMRLPMSFFQQRFGGEVALRIQFNESIAEVIAGDMATVVLDFFVALFFLLLLLQYSWQLTLVGLCIMLLNLAIISVMRNHLLEKSMRLQRNVGEFVSTSVGALQAIETIKANGNESDFFAKWAGHQAKLLDCSQQIDRAVLILSSASTLLASMNTAAIMFIGGIQIMDGLMTAGTFITFNALMGQFQSPLQRIFTMGQRLQSTEMQMRRLEDVFSYPVPREKDPAPAEDASSVRPSTRRVELRGVDFGYSPLDPPLIRNLDLTIEPGQWTALVGGSGSGKSTVANVAAGLYPAWRGEILFDGRPRDAYARDSLAKFIACVGQDIQLFAGTARENISLFDPSVSEEDILKAAADAAIHEDIVRMAGGYGHYLQENGANLSGGQRQRIGIARALATNPSVLILDEATSALDPVTEEIVLENIRRRGCSCLVVAHRLSAFRDCDEILVLDCGKVVQRGTHAGMITQDSPYRRLASGHGEDRPEPA